MSALPGTIVALASPPGAGERAVVRLSGNAAAPALNAVCDDALFERTRAVVRTRIDIGAPSRLPVVVLWSPAPRSYTGEDCAEVLCVGGPHVPGRVVHALIGAREDARPAEPGEFTARAFLNGKLTAEASEGVQALIGARSDEERSAALRLVSGTTGETYRTLVDDIAGALALVEAGIDFTEEEDVVAITPEDLSAHLEGAQRVITDLLGTDRPRARTRDRARVVFAGKPSAGKSTLFNRLLGRDRAVTDDAPGTTRDTLIEPCTLDNGRATVDLADIAGLDETLAGRSLADRAAQEGAARALQEADVVVWCDPVARFESGALDLRPLTPSATLLRVRTKGDLTPSAGGLSVCALDGAGIGALERAIADACAERDASGDGAVVTRHGAALRDTQAALRDAQHATEPEEIAGAMRSALDALAPIAGRVHPDDVIGRIFATFCIGK